MDGERGSASVEEVALAGLVALLFATAIAALVSGPPKVAERELGALIARRIACAPLAANPCRSDPLPVAYGWPLARVVRSLAPAVGPRGDTGSWLTAVDFRRCRRESCATPADGAGHLTTAGRRVTAFTSVLDQRRAGSGVEITYWLYRPTMGWESVVRHAGPGDLAAAAKVRLTQDQDPRLVPLETLAGRDHYRFPASETPPWQWRVGGRYPGRP